MLCSGEFVYQLFAILVHSGGAFGGHYFAYVLTRADSQWYEFNDAKVTLLADFQVERAFGGSGNKNTAYMLMYNKLSCNPDPASHEA